MHSSFRIRTMTAVIGASALATGALIVPTMASAGQPSSPATPSLNLTLLASAPAGASKPDDITKLGSLLYVSYQNNAGKDGSPPGSTSTIVAFDPITGSAITTFTVPGRCDGLTADPMHDRLLASVNEDLNSSLFVIRPGNPVPAHYTYSPSPAETGSDGTNGGTDAISVGSDGTIYVAHSNPDVTLPAPNNTAAVYTMTLSGTTANLTPLFGINDKAEVLNRAGGSPDAGPLALTDPDSNRFIPNGKGGTLIQDAQADSKLVFADHLESGHPRLSQLNLTNATPPTGGPATPQLDDIEHVTGHGTLYVVDQGSGNIYSASTKAVPSGTYFVSQPQPSTGDLPNDPAVGVLDPKTGVVTHFSSPVVSPKGLLFVPTD